MKSYRISNAAKRDLARIYWYGHQEYSEQQANLYFQRLISRFEEIARAPFLYQSVDHIREGYRRSVCGADCIYYRIQGEAVEIMQILGRQDSGSRL